MTRRVASNDRMVCEKNEIIWKRDSKEHIYRLTLNVHNGKHIPTTTVIIIIIEFLKKMNFGNGRVTSHSSRKTAPNDIINKLSLKQGL